MNINVLFLTKFKCLFNKNYQKMMAKSELRRKRKLEAGGWKKYTTLQPILFL